MKTFVLTNFAKLTLWLSYLYLRSQPIQLRALYHGKYRPMSDLWIVGYTWTHNFEHRLTGMSLRLSSGNLKYRLAVNIGEVHYDPDYRGYFITRIMEWEDDNATK